MIYFYSLKFDQKYYKNSLYNTIGSNIYLTFFSVLMKYSVLLLPTCIKICRESIISTLGHISIQKLWFSVPILYTVCSTIFALKLQSNMHGLLQQNGYVWYKKVFKAFIFMCLKLCVKHVLSALNIYTVCFVILKQKLHCLWNTLYCWVCLRLYSLVLMWAHLNLSYNLHLCKFIKIWSHHTSRPGTRRVFREGLDLNHSTYTRKIDISEFENLLMIIHRIIQ